MTKTIHSDEMFALRCWLKAKREERGLSMRALGERFDKPHTFIQNVENGDRRLDVVEYVWYCHELQIEPQEGLALIEQSMIKQTPK
ncbi:MAG: helix-turn-helix transcriptional regulator [Gammaproteobacteria bacterium]|nr:helix-turn-helix transcriptional regulator [Gammaproteobacteria bacterium]